MSANKDLNTTFDTVASLYDKMRPDYPPDVYQAIFDYTRLDKTCNAIEIGIGGGQASLPILKTGCNLTAVECGQQFSDLCRNKFGNYNNFSVVTGKFEDVAFPCGKYDLIYSATAFHWISENIGYTKAFSLLRSGGVFARFANHPYSSKDNPDLTNEINRLYAQYYYKFYNKSPQAPNEYGEKQAEQIAKLSEKYGFTDIKYYLFHRTRVFSAKEYVMLLGTYSDHIAIEKNIRQEFFSKISEAINAHGGSIKIHDTIDLELSRKS